MLVQDYLLTMQHLLCRCVAKYAARLGQCFSTTRTGDGLRLDHHEWSRVDDVIRGGFTFTDGVGLITQDMASVIAQGALGMQDGIVPSAFQIRFGGFKGKRGDGSDVKYYLGWLRMRMSETYNGSPCCRCPIGLAFRPQDASR